MVSVPAFLPKCKRGTQKYNQRVRVCAILKQSRFVHPDENLLCVRETAPGQTPSIAKKG